jgi:hypothetical protein
MSSGQCIPIKNRVWLKFSRICSRGVTPLLSVVFRVVRVVHKFEFRLVTNETPNRWRQMETGVKADFSVRETHVFDRVCMFYHGRCRGCQGILPRLVNQLHSLEQRTG